MSSSFANTCVYYNRKHVGILLLINLALLPRVLLLTGKFKYIQDNTGLSECVVDIMPATEIWDCFHKAATWGSYAFVYAPENHTCHLCVPAREIGNRSLENLPTAGHYVYIRGIKQIAVIALMISIVHQIVNTVRRV